MIKDRPAPDATTVKEKLLALIDICQSMHVVMPQGDGANGFPVSRMNPACLVCTCKGFRMIGLCSHVIAATATYVLEKDCHGDSKSYDQEDYLTPLSAVPTSSLLATRRTSLSLKMRTWMRT